MTTLTLDLDEDIARRLAARAAEEGVSPEELAADVLADSFVTETVPPRRTIEETEAQIRARLARVRDGSAVLIDNEEALKRLRRAAKGGAS